MQKLKLDLEKLDVQSFETGAAALDPSRGTVKGFATTTQPAVETQESCDATCGGNATAAITCGATCNACSAGGTCDHWSCPWTQMGGGC